MTEDVDPQRDGETGPAATEDDDLSHIPNMREPGTRTPIAPVRGIRRRSAGGAMLAAAMIGVQEALEGPKDDPIVVEIDSGTDGDDDDPLAVDLDPYDPSASIAVVRPWLQKDP